MNIRNLEYLVALAKYRHFQRAAEACNVSQPTLSAQLRKLENELGLQLLERTTRKIRFTQTGLRLVEQTQVILREIEALKNMANSSQNSLSQTLDIGIIPTLAPYIFSHMNTLCRENFPEVEMEIHEAQTQHLLAMLESDAIECAIVMASKETSKYVELPLFEEPLVLGVSHKHPYARFDEINMDHLKNNKILMLDDGNCLHNQILRYCYQFELEPDNRFIAMHLETLRRSVAFNKGIAFFPLLSTQEETRDEVKYLRCVAPEPTRKMVLVFHRSDPMRKKYEMLRNIIAKHMEKYLQADSITA
ncbi:LysR family transcriptional regulator [Mangrovibacter phragmitis]|jgi:LysR family hydrogen peroxide-inducible transcriptional activator|uniref:LysR family transcriptional regulator n=1 Tax=Mangrovibacter phragmitis TaxID=1691903 RepID=A0A1B7L3J6_9ENTR|nr:DNA-binding transcriptional regulator OxyR [Mangrovibacter phragmitis]OAT76969.1 LysR family transcriptional regulator [Mangrovibacter phragmitis]